MHKEDCVVLETNRATLEKCLNQAEALLDQAQQESQRHWDEMKDSQANAQVIVTSKRKVDDHQISKLMETH